MDIIIKQTLFKPITDNINVLDIETRNNLKLKELYINDDEYEDLENFTFYNKIENLKYRFYNLNEDEEIINNKIIKELEIKKNIQFNKIYEFQLINDYNNTDSENILFNITLLGQKENKINNGFQKKYYIKTEISGDYDLKIVYYIERIHIIIKVKDIFEFYLMMLQNIKKEMELVEHQDFIKKYIKELDVSFFGSSNTIGVIYEYNIRPLALKHYNIDMPFNLILYLPLDNELYNLVKDKRMADNNIDYNLSQEKTWKLTRDWLIREVQKVLSSNIYQNKYKKYKQKYIQLKKLLKS